MELMPRSGGMGTAVNGLKPPARVGPAISELDFLTSSRINLEKLEEMKGDNARTITADQGFLLEVLLGHVPLDDILRLPIAKLPRIRKISRQMCRHINQLMNVMEPAAAAPYQQVLALFAVAKKNGKGRLIQNAKPVNALFCKAPKMEVPLLSEYIRTVLASSYAGTADAVCYFYQLPLPQEYRPMFAAKVPRGKRGGFDVLQMCALPMGWAWSPAIGQAVSNMLMESLGLAWIDNYIVLASTPEEFDQKADLFMKRADLIELEIDHRPQMSQEVEALGIQFDLVGKRVRLAPSGVTDKTLARTSTAREVFEHMGLLIWESSAKLLPLCEYPEAMALMSRTAKIVGDMTDPKSWERSLTLTESEEREVRSWTDRYARNEWVSPTAAALADSVVWSDASDTLGAFLLVQGEKVLCSSVVKLERATHIFLKELAMAVAGIVEASGRGLVPLVKIDNMPARLALERKLSTCRLANHLIRQVAHLPFSTQWVSTDEELADPYTRKWYPRPKTLTEVMEVHKTFRSAQQHTSAPTLRGRVGPEPIASVKRRIRVPTSEKGEVVPTRVRNFRTVSFE